MTGSKKEGGDVASLTVELLKQIRDNTAATNAGLLETNAKLEQTNAKLEQTNAELASFKKESAVHLRAINARLESVDHHLESVDHQLVSIDQRVGALEKRVESLDTSVVKAFETNTKRIDYILTTVVGKRFHVLERRLSRVEARLASHG